MEDIELIRASGLADQAAGSGLCAAAALGPLCEAEDEDDGGFVLSTPGEFGPGLGRRCGSSCVSLPAWDAVSGEANGEGEYDYDDARLLARLAPALAGRFIGRLGALDLRRVEAERRASLLLDGVAAATAAREQAKAAQRRASRLQAAAAAFGFALAVVAWAAMLATAASGFGPAPPPAACGAVVPVETQALLPTVPACLPVAGLNECKKALSDVEQDMEELETVMHRDIQGYQQMLFSMDKWVSVMKAQSPSRWQALGSCLDGARHAFLTSVIRLNNTLVAEHRLSLGLRRELRRERRALLGAAAAADVPRAEDAEGLGPWLHEAVQLPGVPKAARMPLPRALSR